MAEDRNERMVAELVRRGAVAGESPIHAAFRSVRRHWFLPGTDLDEVYSDAAVVTHRSADGVPVSSSSQPTVMVRMLQQLSVGPGHKVLEVGTGTGYNAALLGTLVGPRGSVTTVDVDPGICEAARVNLRARGISNVSVVAGDGWSGVGGPGPFDRIQATVGVCDLSTEWIANLEEDGVLVAPLWLRAGLQASVAFRRTQGGLESTSVEPCAFMRLRGVGAGDPTYMQVGAWTVSFERPDPEKAALLAQLLEGAPTSTKAAPALHPGWFTPLALRQPDALSLFSASPGGPLVCCGILDAPARSLAVVTSGSNGASEVQVFGGEQAGRRLLDLVRSEAPVDVSSLTITAVPAGGIVEGRVGAMARLTRNNFTFLLSEDGVDCERTFV